MRSSIIDMTRTPEALRSRDFVGELARRLECVVVDAGDVEIDPQYCLDGSAGATNRALTLTYLPLIRDAVRGVADDVAAATRVVVIGGECTIHPAVVAGLRRDPDVPIGLIYFDAHGDFHTTQTTSSGNLWGMPLALACGRGDEDLIDSFGGPAVPEWACAHLGGQALDESEARALASSQVAHFGTGMLSTPAGLAAFSAWVAATAPRVCGFYVAFDVDVLDGSGGLSVALPEEHGMTAATAAAVLDELAGQTQIMGMGITTLALSHGNAEVAVRKIEDLICRAFA